MTVFIIGFSVRPGMLSVMPEVPIAVSFVIRMLCVPILYCGPGCMTVFITVFRIINFQLPFVQIFFFTVTIKKTGMSVCFVFVNSLCKPTA